MSFQVYQLGDLWPVQRNINGSFRWAFLHQLTSLFLSCTIQYTLLRWGIAWRCNSCWAWKDWSCDRLRYRWSFHCLARIGNAVFSWFVYWLGDHWYVLTIWPHWRICICKNTKIPSSFDLLCLPNLPQQLKAYSWAFSLFDSDAPFP